MFLQKTIRRDAEVRGIGLHGGKPCRLVFRPAPPDAGVCFVRADLPGRPSLTPQADRVMATSLATTLGEEAFSISTVEHCLSTLAAFRIDNVFIELYGPEIPIGDGSAFVFMNALIDAGTVEQEAPRKYAYVVDEILYEDGDKYAKLSPYHGLRVTCTIDFDHPSIGRQEIDIDVNEYSFARELSCARTFGFYRDVEAMRARGLALGASLDNAIALDDKGVVNPEGLRFPDEFVRHKALDALGDLVNLGMPLMGHLSLYKAGHHVVNQLVKKVLSSPEKYRRIELGSSRPDEGALDSRKAWVFQDSPG